MENWLWALIGILAMVIIALLLKIHLLHRSAEIGRASCRERV